MSVVIEKANTMFNVDVTLIKGNRQSGRTTQALKTLIEDCKENECQGIFIVRDNLSKITVERMADLHGIEYDPSKIKIMTPGGYREYVFGKADIFEKGVGGIIAVDDDDKTAAIENLIIKYFNSNHIKRFIITVITGDDNPFNA